MPDMPPAQVHRLRDQRHSRDAGGKASSAVSPHSADRRGGSGSRVGRISDPIYLHEKLPLHPKAGELIAAEEKVC